MDLTDSSAVVTGGASGLGLATVDGARRRAASPSTIVDLPPSAGAEVADGARRPRHLRARRRTRRRGRRRGARRRRPAGLRCGRWCTAPAAAARSGSSNRDGTPGDYDLYREIVDINLVGTLQRAAARGRADGRATSRSTASAASACSPRRSPRGRARSARSPTPRPRPASSGMTLVAARDLSRAQIRVCSIAPGRLRHPDPEPVLRRDPARAGRPGAAPGASRPAGGVRLDGAAHHRQPDAQRRDDPSRRRDPDGAAVTERLRSSPTSSDGVLVVTINRPEARNAINTGDRRGDRRGDGPARRRPRAGRRRRSPAPAARSAPAWTSRRSSPASARRSRAAASPGIVERPPAKPLIAAVEGYAIAGGFEIALACDMIVAAENARFGLPEVKRGLVAAGGGLMRLPAAGPVPRWPWSGPSPATLVRRPARVRGRPGQPAHAEPGAALTAALELGRADRRQRPAGRPRDQADPRRGARAGRRRDVRPAARDQRAGARLRGRPRGRDRLQGEARAAVARPLTVTDQLSDDPRHGRR